MIVLGIDPGTTHSGVVVYDTTARLVTRASKGVENAALLDVMRWFDGIDVALLEGVSPRMMTLGWDTIETIEWIGRMYERLTRLGISTEVIRRDDVKRILFGRTNLKDADKHVRQHVINTIGPKGTKKDPGPTFGVSGHAWQALGVVVAYLEREAAEAEQRRRSA